MNTDAPASEEPVALPSLGERLRTLRETRGLSLEDLATRTRFLLPHLSALERGDYAALPASRPFIRGLLKAHVQTLDETPETWLAEFEREYPMAQHDITLPPQVGQMHAPGKDACPFLSIALQQPRRVGGRVALLIFLVSFLLVLGLLAAFFGDFGHLFSF